MALPPRELFERVVQARWPDRAGAALISAAAQLRHRWSRPRGPELPTREAISERAPPRFTTSPSPQVSIVVPVYGQPAATFACLESLATVPAGCSFEVVVVDDCSPDDTLAMLRTMEGLRVVSNEVNLGFIGASNAGAAVAQAPYLCFLNNDTTVTAGWLGVLLQTFEEHEKVGVVGPRLLFPDGRIQEAGGVIFRDGSGSHFGRNRSPGPSAYAFVRPVDYVSGACLVVPRLLFENLGGFDTHFAPAYYEDTDLAFRARQEGLQVLHQPGAAVYHHEGITHGRDLGRGPKRHQVLNRERFLARWSQELQHHPSPGTRTANAADRRRGPRLLFVADTGADPLRAWAVRLAAAARPAWWHPRASTEERLWLGAHGVEPLGLSEAPNLEALLRAAPGRFEAVIFGGSKSADWATRAHRAAPDLLRFIAEGAVETDHARPLPPPGPDVQTWLDAIWLRLRQR